MDTVTKKKFRGQVYYNADELLAEQPELFKGCRNSRAIIEKRKIDDDNYLFAKLVNDKYRVTYGSSKKFDKMFLLKDWVDEELKTAEVIEEAPDIIELEDYEKFKDDDGNILEIETIGERDADKCYFNLDDVAKGFGILNLRATVTDERRQYEKNLHYKFFICVKSGTVNIAANKKKLYLTYMGILRVLFVSRSGNTKSFVGWATKTLFTAQMGTKNEKKKLASSLLGVTVPELKAVFSKTNHVLPAIYLFSLGTVKDLRKTLDISAEYKDDQIVAKIGMTKDLERRSGEHARNYGKLKKVNLEMVHYNYVDPQYMSSAETDLKDAFCLMNFMFQHEKYDELIIFNKSLLPKITKQYESIGKSYIGHVAELVSKIKDLESEKELTKEKHANELSKKDLEIANGIHSNEMLKEKHLNEIMKKDMELMKKEMEIMKLSKRK